jgi:hypothetical protein
VIYNQGLLSYVNDSFFVDNTHSPAVIDAGSALAIFRSTFSGNVVPVADIVFTLHGSTWPAYVEICQCYFTRNNVHTDSIFVIGTNEQENQWGMEFLEAGELDSNATDVPFCLAGHPPYK